MLLLLLDVRGDLPDVRLADAEDSVSALPGKPGRPGGRLGDSARGAYLYLADHVGVGDRRRHFDEEMDVILHPTDRAQRPTLLPENAAEVGVETRFERRVDERCTLFRGENDVCKQTAIRVWHGENEPCGGPGRMVPRTVRGSSHSFSMSTGSSSPEWKARPCCSVPRARTIIRTKIVTSSKPAMAQE